MPSAPSAWSTPTSNSEAQRRAGGRRKFNAVRRFKADLRRAEVQRLFAEYGFARGAQARIARELKVNRSTISCDIGRLWAPDGQTCPTCERWMNDKGWEQLADDRTTRLGAVLAMTRAMSKVA